MSETEVNKAVLARAYELWHDSKGAAIDDLMGVFADRVIFGSLGEGRDPTALTALSLDRAATRAHFEQLLTGWTMNHYKVTQLIAEDDRVVVVGHTSWTNKATGKTFASAKVDIWRFEDGFAVEFYEYYDTAKLFAASIAETEPALLHAPTALHADGAIEASPPM